MQKRMFPHWQKLMQNYLQLDFPIWFPHICWIDIITKLKYSQSSKLIYLQIPHPFLNLCFSFSPKTWKILHATYRDIWILDHIGVLLLEVALSVFTLMLVPSDCVFYLSWIFTRNSGVLKILDNQMFCVCFQVYQKSSFQLRSAV